MTYPFFVYTKIESVDLYQLKDGRFQMIKQGNLSPLMFGYEYIIIENKLANYLESFNIPDVKYKNAVVWNRGLNIEYKNYSQLIIDRSFSPDQVKNLDLVGIKIFVMDNSYFFVSPELKETLEKSEFDYLLFSEGLSLFA